MKYYCLPTKFLIEWRYNLKHLISVKDLKIDCQEFICAHQGFVYSKEDETKEFSWITAVEYDYLKSRYEFDGEIYCLDDSINPEVCMECRLQRLGEYEIGHIKVIKKDIPNQPVVIDLGSEEETTPKKGKSKRSNESSVKSSRRFKKRRGSESSVDEFESPLASTSTRTRTGRRGKNTKQLSCSITPFTTVKEVMFDIMETYKVPPLYQKLYKDSVELKDIEKTMRDYSVLPGDTLEVEIYDMEVEDFVVSDHEVEMEMGFAGTRLFGNSHLEVSSSAEVGNVANRISTKVNLDYTDVDGTENGTNELDSPNDLNPWSCSHCTFLNEIGSTCQICSNEK
jgi:hypothetical protein